MFGTNTVVPVGTKLTNFDKEWDAAVKAGWAFKADTIEELCKQVKLPVERVTAIVKAYNEAVEKGTLDQMNPRCTYKTPHPIKKAPFYAVPFQGGMTATFGGPLINAKAEIQNLDGESIPGLYAAGNSAGGIFFHNYAGGAQLGAALV